MHNALTTPGVMRLILFAAIVMVIGDTLEEYWPLLMTEAGVPHASLGLILAIFCGVQALASLLAHRLYEQPS